MISNFFIYSFVLLVCIFTWPSSVVYAQRCDTDFEQIIKLPLPSVGAYSVWDTVYGDNDKQEYFQAGQRIKSWNTLIVSFEEASDEKTLRLIRFERRGRKDWEKNIEVPDFVKTVRFVKHVNADNEDIYALLSLTRGKDNHDKAWFGRFNVDGDFISRINIAEKGVNVRPYDLFWDTYSKTYKVVTHITKNDNSVIPHTRIYTLNKNGEVMGKKSYMIGTENTVFRMIPYGEKGGMFAVGSIKGEDGRFNGWIVRLSKHGGIVWQRQYPRGNGAILSAVTSYIKDHIIVGGYALPSDKTSRGGWIMTVQQDTGNIVWQRYFVGEVMYSVEDIHVSNDNLIAVFLEADPLREKDKGEDEGNIDEGSDHEKSETGMSSVLPELEETQSHDFIHVLTLNPRGYVFTENSYHSGEGGDLNAVIQGPNQEHIMIGSAITPFMIENSDKDEDAIKSSSHDGWIVVAPPTEPYDDPCLD